MIKNLQSGAYKLVKNNIGNELLYLGNKPYIWRTTPTGTCSLEATHRLQTDECILSTGQYRLYSVSDDNIFSNLTHLELLVGSGKWQGYTLPQGLPTMGSGRASFRPTNETITNASYNKAVA